MSFAGTLALLHAPAGERLPPVLDAQNAALEPEVCGHTPRPHLPR